MAYEITTCEDMPMRAPLRLISYSTGTLSLHCSIGYSTSRDASRHSLFLPNRCDSVNKCFNDWIIQ